MLVWLRKSCFPHCLAEEVQTCCTVWPTVSVPEWIYVSSSVIWRKVLQTLQLQRACHASVRRTGVYVQRTVLCPVLLIIWYSFSKTYCTSRRYSEVLKKLLIWYFQATIRALCPHSIIVFTVFYTLEFLKPVRLVQYDDQSANRMVTITLY